MGRKGGTLPFFLIGVIGFLAASFNFALISHNSITTIPHQNEQQKLDFVTGVVARKMRSHGQSYAQPLLRLGSPMQASLKFCDACPMRCQNQMLQRITNIFNASAIREAIKSETEPFCTPCRHNCSCYLLQRIGYDEAAPEALRRSRTFTTLKSIPHERRVQNYLNINETLGPLSIYNPSIITIPDSAKEKLQGLHNNKIPAYLVSFRVTNVGACGKEQSFDWRRYGVNLLSLVVLDQELEFLDEILLDINSMIDLSSLFGKRSEAFSAFEDYRLFAIDDIVYLSHGTHLMPIKISSFGQGLASYQNHPTKLVVSILNQGSTPPFEVSTIRGLNKGKNFQFFQDETGEIFLEIWPDHPHSVARLNMNGTVMGSLRNSSGIPVVSDMNNASNRSAPYDAFSVHRLPPFTTERGSTCCVKLDHHFLPVQYAHNPYLYMGISHSRTKPKTKIKAYLSRLYVFEPHWPFDVVARSGPFCLGSSHLEEEPFQSFATSRQLRLRGNTYDCPMVHYVSGMVATVDSTILIAYGILDCFSRIVEVRKEDLARMVFTNLNTSQRVV